jgi:beta-glucanase (GH16 family)
VFASTTTNRLDLDIVARAGVPTIAAVSVSPVRSGIPTIPSTSGSGSATGLDAPAPVRLWSDEFDGPAGQAASPAWTAALGAGGWGNHELQSYTARPANASLDGAGHLVLRALREQYTGADQISTAFTSARLSTENSFSFTYGRIEARARIPDGVGLLPAIWTMGSDLYTAGWPEAGEADIVEAPVRATGHIHGIIHGPDGTPAGYSAGGSREPPAGMADNFHVYSLDWYPGVLVFSVDAAPYAVIAQADLAPGQHWVFDHPFHLLLSLAVGGDWPGTPPARAPFPQQMVLDYIRVTH